jgi:hypothetical protein
MKTYQVWEYDVWGNREEGFIVNDQFNVGTIELKETDITNNNRILQALSQAGYLHSLEDLTVEGYCAQQMEVIDESEIDRPVLALIAETL